MPFHRTVHSKQFTVHGNKNEDTVYCLPSTVYKHRRRLGFTLIELLVVIAIISVLAGVAFVSFLNAREKSIDKKRKSDILALQQALFAAKTDDGYYKNNITDGTLTPKYIGKVPQDPVTVTVYTYTPAPPTCDNAGNNKCTSFTLTTCLDNAKDAQKDNAAMYASSGCTTPASFTVTSPQ